MKKLFTLIAMALLGMGSASAQDVIELSWDTMIKDEEGANAADQTNTGFYLADGTTESGFILTRDDGDSRTQAKTEREGCAKVLNFKNDKVQKLIIPKGTGIYHINFYGWSQGDNWTYLYAYGSDPKNWEFEDKIGTKIMDNKTIIENAVYPLDPCVVVAENAKNGYSPAYHNAGYCFASIDFGNDPYTGQFCFVFSGNNQERAWIEVYTTREAADKAPKAEAVTIGKENSQQNFLNAEGISAVKAEKFSGAIFNMAGQRVDRNFKGLVIKDGKKIIVK